jgi:hypothetical protein
MARVTIVPFFMFVVCSLGASENRYKKNTAEARLHGESLRAEIVADDAETKTHRGHSVSFKSAMHPSTRQEPRIMSALEANAVETKIEDRDNAQVSFMSGRRKKSYNEQMSSFGQHTLVVQTQAVEGKEEMQRVNETHRVALDQRRTYRSAADQHLTQPIFQQKKTALPPTEESVGFDARAAELERESEELRAAGKDERATEVAHRAQVWEKLAESSVQEAASQRAMCANHPACGGPGMCCPTPHGMMSSCCNHTI